MSNILYFIFSVCMVFTSIVVIFSSHAIYSLLFLVLTFVLAALLLLLLECEFLALLFIVVYVGAIAVFFLFAIMMLESKLVNLSKNKTQYFPVGISFAFVLLIPILDTLNVFFNETHCKNNCFYLNKYQNWCDLIDSTYDTTVYGQVLYSYFVLQFLIAGLILLLVIIGVVHLTSSFEKQTLQQSTFKQLSRKIKIF